MIHTENMPSFGIYSLPLCSSSRSYFLLCRALFCSGGTSYCFPFVPQCRSSGSNSEIPFRSGIRKALYSTPIILI